MMNGFPDTALAPAGEALRGLRPSPDGIGHAKAFGQIGPGGPRWRNPEHGVDKEAVIVGIATGVAGLSGQQGGNACEVGVGDGVAVHERASGLGLGGPLNAEDRSMVPASKNFSFVHTT